MSKVPALLGTRFVVRFAFASMTAALLAGCADSSRFIGNPLGNPFKSASIDPAPTGSYERDMAPPPSSYTPRSSAIVSRPLAAPSEMPARHVVSYETPAHASPRLAQTYVAPRTERIASAPSGHAGWSAAGGMTVIAASGETAAVLAQRYNVPTDALLRANGFSSSAQIRPGARVIVPVYSTTGGRDARVAATEPVRTPRDHSSRERLAKQVADTRAKRETTREAKNETKREARNEAKRETKHEARNERRTDSRHEAAPEHATMHWVKGPQAAKLAGVDRKDHGREKALTKLGREKAERTAEVAEGKASRKVAKVETVKDKPVLGKASKDKPSKLAKAEVPVSRKTAVDPTPTASLPPAAEKVAVNGNPEFRWPAHGRIIQGFKTGGNDGINIAVPEGTSVKAAESGVVAYAGSEIKGFGNLVLIRHPNGYVSAYANNGDLQVHRGEQVKRGQTIAKSGQSGNVASPQLHFELRKGSTPVDPTRYLAGL